MSWGCCTPNGECKRGHGCPAGVALHQGDGRERTACTGHPTQGHGVARVGKQHPLRRVQLSAAQPKPLHPLRHIGRRLLQLLGVAALLAIWMLADSRADAGGACKDTRWQCATNWETEA